MIFADEPLDVSSPRRWTGDATGHSGRSGMDQPSLSADFVRAGSMAPHPWLGHCGQNDIYKAMKPAGVTWIRVMPCARRFEPNCPPQARDVGHIVYDQRVDFRGH